MNLSDFEKEAINLLATQPKSRSRNCFNSAINHLEKAHRLLDIDLEMAAFRAITAEEEASSGLMYCLKELQYPDAEKLNPRNHAQKNAVTAFMKAVTAMPLEMQNDHHFEFSFAIDKNESEPKLELVIRNASLFPDHKLRPEPPLHFFAATGDRLRSFAPYIKQLVSSHGENDFLSHIRRLANFRNEILYANDSGLPKIEQIPSLAIEQWKSHVFAKLYGYLMIRPYKEHQGFVCQLITAFLFVLEKIPLGDLHPDS